MIQIECVLLSDVADSYSKLAESLERMARAEPDKTMARTLARGADAMQKLKKVR